MKQIAFWTDSGVEYPHICSGVIAEWYDDGKVRTFDYGVGVRPKPELVLSESAGLTYQEKLVGLRMELRAANEILRKKFMAKLADIKL